MNFRDVNINLSSTKNPSKFNIYPHVNYYFLINSSPRTAAFKVDFYGSCLNGLCLELRPNGFIYRPSVNILLHVLMITKLHGQQEL